MRLIQHSGSLTCLALALLAGVLWGAGPAAGAAETAETADRAIAAALARISAQCPQQYPDIVAPVPGPDGLNAESDAALVELLDSWNPAMRVRVAQELALRGRQVLHPLMTAAASDKPQRRAGALDAFHRMIRHQVRNWQEFRPDETNHRTAQTGIRQEFAELLLDVTLERAGDPELDVRRAALSVLNVLEVRTGQVATAILALSVDEDEYLADQASGALRRDVGLSELDPGAVLPVVRRALQNPLPRGKGAVILAIGQFDEPLQRELIPDLLAHLDWQPDRDTMFGASGQAEALNLLTQLRVQELVPRLPGLMDKTMRGAGLFDPCVASIKAFGPDARPILAALRERIAHKDAELQQLAGRDDRRSRGRREHLQGRIDALREAVTHVEQ